MRHKGNDKIFLEGKAAKSIQWHLRQSRHLACKYPKMLVKVTPKGCYINYETCIVFVKFISRQNTPTLPLISVGDMLTLSRTECMKAGVEDKDFLILGEAEDAELI